MDRIELLKQGRFWMVYHRDSAGAEVQRLFGTRILPTPFMSTTPAVEVQRRIQSLNPDRIVTIRQEISNAQ